MNDEELRSRFEDLQFPDPGPGEDRSWEVVGRAYRSGLEERGPGTARRARGFRRRGLWAIFLALVAGIVVISPARALVADWVQNAVVGPDVESERVSTAPPGGGRLLVQSPAGTWVTSDDGSRRLLGDFDEAVWSPKGLYVGAVAGRQLVALEPDGDPRWALTRPTAPSLPAWDSPDGFRIAYVEGDQLRVVAGDGTGDRVLAVGVDPVRPTWFPGVDRLIAFARPGGRVEILDSESGRRVNSFTAGEPVTGLEWADDGSRLLVSTRRSVSLRDPEGRTVWRDSARTGFELESAAIRPGTTDEIALVERGRQSRVSLTGPGRRPTVLLVAGSLSDPIWSPDGVRLMIAWPETDQWLFLSGPELRRVEALSGISDQIDPGGNLPSAFPEVQGWCCIR